jgi:ATP-dependent DNA ligase
VEEAPSGDEWAHDLKFDGYRMHARLDNGAVHLLTRTGLDWTGRYQSIAAALRALTVAQTYLDGELCGVQPDGLTSDRYLSEACGSWRFSCRRLGGQFSLCPMGL